MRLFMPFAYIKIYIIYFELNLLADLFDKCANLLSGMLLLLDIFGSVCGDKRSRIDDDFAVLEDDLPLHPRLDLPRGGNLLLLAGLPFL